MNAKFLYKTLLAVGIMGMASGCSNFGDTNIDPEHLNDGNIDYKMVFSNAQHQASGSDNDVWTNGIIYGGTMLQHVATVNYSEAFYTYNENYNSGLWRSLYSGNRASARDIKIVMNAWQNAPEHQGDYQIARIMKAYIYHRLTDLYGDIPYTEAAAGIDYPKYDSQKFIYEDILKELDEAQNNLKGMNSSLGGADFYYNGDVNKWRKFANSLMLRVAMRMSEVAPEEAQKWVRKAVENGLFESIADNSVLQHTDGDPSNDSSNPYGKIYSERDAGRFFLSKFFVDMLKNTNDPRLALIGVVCESDPTRPYSSGDAYTKGNADPAKQVGMPSGYDLKGGDWDIEHAEGFPGKDKYETYYSTVNRYTFSDPKAPTMVLTYAENQLLLAEAAWRGWLNGVNGAKTPEEYYNEGVTAAMQQFSLYPDAKSLYDTYLGSTAIQDYLTANPFDTGNALKQISTQYYILMFCDEYEAFANWRRTGYPELEAINVNYPNCATGGTIPRRFTYPLAESQNNSVHYKEALSGLQPAKDEMTSRMWWDVKK